MADGRAAALSCDLGASGTVTVDLRADGSHVVSQLMGTQRLELASDTLWEGGRGVPGELTVLRLLCGDGADGLAVGVAFHAGQIQFVEGIQGVMLEQSVRFTVSALGSAPARLDEVGASLIERP